MTADESDRQARLDKLADDVDAILDEIDEVPEENAEEFVRSYVQRGGQGWSTFVDPSFFMGAAMASVVANVTYDAFKKMVAKVVRAINNVPGPVETRVYEPGGSLDPDFEYILQEAWHTASSIVSQEPAHHSRDEATALHWAVFIREFLVRGSFVRINPDQLVKIHRAGAARPEHLTHAQMVSLIISQWLARNPNAEIGIWES